MNGVKLFKKFLMPCGICAAVPIIKPKEEPKLVNNESQSKKLIRPSELPIYTFESAESTGPRQLPCKENTQPNILEQGFGTVRKSVQDVLKQFTGYTGAITNTIDTGVAHSKVTLDYLREETNVLPRIGAVGVGGLSGLILGLRGGKFKRLIYSSTGALAVASICYPKQAQEGMTLAKYYISVGYNFLYGVKPGEKQLEIHWPELPKVPSNMSEFTNLAGNAVKSTATTVGEIIMKGLDALKEFSEPPKAPSTNSSKQD